MKLVMDFTEYAPDCNPEYIDGSQEGCGACMRCADEQYRTIMDKYERGELTQGQASSELGDLAPIWMTGGVAS